MTQEEMDVLRDHLVMVLDPRNGGRAESFDSDAPRNEVWVTFLGCSVALSIEPT